MGVVVPNSNNRKGINIAATLGAVAGNPASGLNVLESVRAEDIALCHRLETEGFCRCSLAEGVDSLYVHISAYGGADCAQVFLEGSHTGVVKIVRNGETVFEKEARERQDESFAEEMTIAEILQFAEMADAAELKAVLGEQIRCNTAIAEEGLSRDYGANIGKTVIRRGRADFPSRVKGKVAAGSDARMSGCGMPVVINSGSGNQGLAVSLPVIEYAGERSLPEEELLRALAVSNLISIYAKKKIGRLSAFCGASTAAAAAGAGIARLKGWDERRVAQVVESTLVNVGGLICDGAKSTCAAKLATALDAMLIAVDMLENGNSFGRAGLMGRDAEETLANVCFVGKNGMAETDVNVLRIMTGEIVTSRCRGGTCGQR